MRNFIYIIGNESFSPNVYKVGGTDDPVRRLTDPAYSQANEKPYFYKSIYAFPDKINEYNLHKKLGKYMMPPPSSEEMYELKFDLLEKKIEKYFNKCGFEFKKYFPCEVDMVNKNAKRNSKKSDYIRNSIAYGQRKILKIQLKKIKMYLRNRNCGKEIAKLLYKRGKLIVSLLAKMQSGKTLCCIAVATSACLEHDIDPSNVFFVTGMSDNDWETQITESLPDMWKKNVYHRQNINNLDIPNNSIIFLDECHFGTASKGGISNFLEELGFYDKKEFIKKNIKIVQVSATPDGMLLDSSNTFGNKHIKYKFIPSELYFGDAQLLEGGFLKDMYNLTIEDNCEKLCNFIENRFSDSRYHIIRLSMSLKKQRKEKENLINICEMKGWNYQQCDSENKIDLNEHLNEQPKKHTIIFIKNMLRAAKTIHKEHIGIVHDRLVQKPNNSTIMQSFLGRMCGYHDFRDFVIFTDIKSVKRYIHIFDNFEYDDYDGYRMKKNIDGEIMGDQTLMTASKFGKECVKQDNYILWSEEFQNIKDLESFLNDQFITFNGVKIRIRKHKLDSKHKEYKIKDGYEVSTVFRKNNKKIKQLSSDDRLYRIDLKNFINNKLRLTYPTQKNIDDKKLKLSSIYPFYENSESPRNSQKFLLSFYKNNPANQINTRRRKTL